MLRNVLFGAIFIGLLAVPQIASAADFLTIKLDVSGYARRDRQTFGPSGFETYHREGALNSSLELVVLGSDLSSFGFSRLSGPKYLYESIYGAGTKTNLTIGQDVTSYTRGPTGDFTVNACGDFTNIAFGTTVAVNPLCSTINFFRGEPTGVNLAGDGASFTGFVTAITVTQGFGTPNFLGVLNAPVLAIPEPTSWAMIVLGMGAVGYATRRRRPLVSKPTLA
ncbi:PEPxxWA-CTERM sorting domain-containing protein [Sphingomonas sp. A2-49]|uniref:PEPxxWA-CTERM sorting domain-containing protein n=1 Tax=Sphingomonas sp. A2-49 TaxID=1391375 RepID=UPI0021CE1ADD|nr:PEPxxWA-CTERM sorting domain-containing protein [Sphingomonas sp. A2-49]MCU6455494.1 PEPxxWA-CTERM sorting domain-containing protein [Sphingomonas sp. A2-49]